MFITHLLKNGPENVNISPGPGSLNVIYSESLPSLCK
jgi:hypothetical protein